MARQPTVYGGDQLRGRLRYIADGLRPALEDRLFKHAETVRTNVVADIRVQKLPAGVRPVAGPGRKKHIPSPPGGPPNSDTGSLMDRYTTTMGSFSRTRVFSRVVAGVRYARWLELGTARMLPRPHLIPRFRGEAEAFRRSMREMMADLVRASKGKKRK